MEIQLIGFQLGFVEPLDRLLQAVGHFQNVCSRFRPYTDCHASGAIMQDHAVFLGIAEINMGHILKQDSFLAIGTEHDITNIINRVKFSLGPDTVFLSADLKCSGRCIDIFFLQSTYQVIDSHAQGRQTVRPDNNMHFLLGSGPDEQIGNAFYPLKMLTDFVFKKGAVGFNMPGITFRCFENDPDYG